jgi:hypothetical protein
MGFAGGMGIFAVADSIVAFADGSLMAVGIPISDGGFCVRHDACHGGGVGVESVGHFVVHHSYRDIDPDFSSVQDGVAIGIAGNADGLKIFRWILRCSGIIHDINHFLKPIPKSGRDPLWPHKISPHQLHP